MRSERALVTGVLLLFVAVLLASTAMLGPIARAAPILIGVPTLALLGLEFTRDLRTRGAQANTVRSRAEIALVAWLGGLLVCLSLGGLAPGASIWLGLFLRYRSQEPWRVVAVAALGMAAALVAASVLLLSVPITAGAVIDWGV